MNPRLLCTLVAASLGTAATAAPAASGTDLTLYRSDNASLYASSNDGAVNDGYAVVHEPRRLELKGGVQDLSLDGLPTFLDSEALALNVEGGSAKVLSQRLLLSQGQNAALAGLVGTPVEVLGDNAQPLASGTLLRADDGLLVREDRGGTSLIRNYASVRSSGGHFSNGSILKVRLDAARAGAATATLSYPTSGLGWRAAYVGTLQPGDGCRMQFESRASIANRSGRDWNGVRLKLVAGEPNINRGARAPRPMAMMAKAAVADAMPEQAALGDYRSYTLPGAVDLPDGSVSQTPLYATRTVECERTALLDGGGGWFPPKPNLDQGDYGVQHPIVSTLRFKAFDSLPAGNLRVLTIDRDGHAEFVGEGRVDDTPKGQNVDLNLGNVFDLSATRERSSFKLDKAARTMDEGYRIVLSNAGDSARTVTVREHPNRWRQWSLVSSSAKPAKQSPDVLEFQVSVPARGELSLDYAVRYSWTAQDE